jgi:hypothetical protein
LFRYRSETPKQNETNRNKNVFGFAKQSEKQPQQIEFRLVSVRTEKKIDCFEETLATYSTSREIRHFLRENSAEISCFQIAAHSEVAWAGVGFILQT